MNRKDRRALERKMKKGMAMQDEQAKTIQNKIRAFAPKPGAYTTLNGKRIKIFSTEIESKQGYSFFVLI